MAAPSAAPDASPPPSASESQLREVLNAIRHLERSQRELRAALAEAHDDDFALAVTENVGAIANKTQLAVRLQREVDMERQLPDRSDEEIKAELFGEGGTGDDAVR